MAKHAPDDRLTTAQRSGLDDDPLGMRRGRIIREAADFSLLVIQQPADTLLRWVPFNLWSAALLTRMFAQQVGLEPGELVWTGGDTHLYLNHEALIAEQLSREPQGRPRLEIVRRPPSIFDYTIEDFVVHDYTPHGPIKAPVAV